MKKKLLSGVQHVVFLAFVTACVMDYHIAIKEGVPPYLSASKGEITSLKNPLFNSLSHNNLVGEFYFFNGSPILANTLIEANHNLASLVNKEALNLVEKKEVTPLDILSDSQLDLKNEIYSYLEKKDIHLIEEKMDFILQNNQQDAFLLAFVDFFKEEENKAFATQVVQLLSERKGQKQGIPLLMGMIDSLSYFYINLDRKEAPNQADLAEKQSRKEMLLFMMDMLDFEKYPQAKESFLYGYVNDTKVCFQLAFLIDKAIEKGAIYDFNDFFIQKFLDDKDSFLNKHLKVLIERNQDNFFANQFATEFYWAVLEKNQERLQLLHEIYQKKVPFIGMVLNLLTNKDEQEISNILQQLSIESKKLEGKLMYHYKEDAGSLYSLGGETYQLEELLFQYAYKYDHPILLKKLVELKKEDDSFIIDMAHIPFKDKNIPWVRFFMSKGINENTKTKEHGFSTFYDMYPEVFEEINHLDHPEKHALEQDLFDAVQKGDVQQAQTVIKKGIAVNKRSQEGQSLLHVAVLNKNIPMIQLLLDNNADVMARNKAGVDPLLLAAYLGDTELFKLIYDRWVKKERQIKAEKLEKMAKTGYYGSSVVETCNCGLRDYWWVESETLEPLLLHFELDKNNPKILRNAFDSKVNALFVSIYFGYQGIFDILMDDNVDIHHCVGGEQETPLVIAVQKGHEQMVKRLLDKKADPNRGSCGADTPLKYAVSNGHMDIAKLLIEKGAQMETRKSSDSSSVLAYAVKQNNKEIVELLLEKGAHPDACSTQQDSALEVATFYDRTEIAKLLIEKGAMATDRALLRAVQNKNHELIKLFVARGADVNYKISDRKLNHQTDDESTKALLYELGLKDEDSLETLLFEQIDTSGRDTEKMLDLIKKGVNVNAKNTRGDTPLLAAFKKDPFYFDQITLLIDNGADPTILDKNGQSVLDYLTLTTRVEVFEKIVAKKPKLNKENISHYVRYSLRMRSTSLLELMLEQGLQLPKTYKEDSDYEKGFLKDACCESKEMCAFLLDHGFDINEKIKNEDHFILRLVWYSIEKFKNPIEYLSFLIEKGVDLKAVDSHRHAGLLHQLWFDQNKEILRFLVQQGLDINMKNSLGYTPLMTTIYENDVLKINVDYIKELIALGADVTAKNYMGETALDIFNKKDFHFHEKWEEISALLK